jgi:hypothetical protein
MIDRNKHGIRRIGAKARLAIAAAVLVGGGAASAVVATSHSGATIAQSAGYTTKDHHTLSEQTALAEAFASWSRWPSTSLTTLTQMAPMRTFNQVWQQSTELAEQRGIVVLATKEFLVVKSFDGSLHLWALSGDTRVKDVGASTTGMYAMTGSWTAATTAMTTGNMIPSDTWVAGSATAVNWMTTPVATPTTITIGIDGEVITITVDGTTAMVTQPAAMTAWTGMPTRSFLSAFHTTMGLERGDLVFVAGTRTQGLLRAKLVLFAAPLTTMPSSTMSSTAFSSVSPTPTSTGTETFAGTHS